MASNCNSNSISPQKKGCPNAGFAGGSSANRRSMQNPYALPNNHTSGQLSCSLLTTRFPSLACPLAWHPPGCLLKEIAFHVYVCGGEARSEAGRSASSWGAPVWCHGNVGGRGKSTFQLAKKHASTPSARSIGVCVWTATSVLAANRFPKPVSEKPYPEQTEAKTKGYLCFFLTHRRTTTDISPAQSKGFYGLGDPQKHRVLLYGCSLSFFFLEAGSNMKRRVFLQTQPHYKYTSG